MAFDNERGQSAAAYTFNMGVCALPTNGKIKGSINEQPNIVKSFTIGNTRINIADNYYKNKTEDEIQVILKNIVINAQRVLSVPAADQSQVNTIV